MPPFRRSPQNGGRRGIQQLWVAALCVISFGMGYTFGVASEYDVPMQSMPLQASVTKPCSSSAIQDIAQELIENTLGVEMLGQADKIDPAELKKVFYKALSSALGSNSKAVAAQNQKSRSDSKAVIAQTEVAVEQSFLAIATSTGTHKTQAHINLKKCTEDETKDGCLKKGCKNVRCIPYGNFYDTLYQSQLGHLSRSDAEPFQGLEIGFYQGSGFETYQRWLPNAELHTMEISCLPHGPMSEGKWPHQNTATHKKLLHDRLVEKERLHCGDASKIEWINQIWSNHMKRNDAPPLKLVIDDGSHLSKNLATSLFFWFPRIEPGGYLVLEGIQPVDVSNRFRTQVMPQIMADLHYCGEPRFPDEGPCFPTIQPLLAFVHCEMHICVFKRNDEPAQELSPELSSVPPHALDASKCPSLQKQAWER
jgi:hypothetical protein